MLDACVATVTVTAAAAFPETVRGLGDTEQVELAGAPAHAKLTEPLNPLVPVTFRV